MVETTNVCIRCGGTEIRRRFEKGFVIMGNRLPDAIQAKCVRCKKGWLERVPSAHRKGQKK